MCSSDLSQFYTAGDRYPTLEDYTATTNIGPSGDIIPTGYKPRYSIKENKMDEFMDMLMSDQELAEHIHYMKQYSHDEIPKGADPRFMVFYSRQGNLDSALSIDKIMSTKYKDMLVENGEIGRAHV